jgi:uncharacterized membrane protein
MIPLEHVHPMLVHFPIVLVILAAGVDVLILARGGDLSARRALPQLSLALLLLAAASALATAFFGDMALDAAVGRGVSEATVETHEGLGWTTLSVIGVYALLRLATWLRKVPLGGARAALGTVLSLGCVGLVLATAYFGGQLVYTLGVNVLALHQ